MLIQRDLGGGEAGWSQAESTRRTASRGKGYGLFGGLSEVRTLALLWYC